MKNLKSILKKHSNVFFSVLMISFSLFVVSCDDDDDNDIPMSSKNIVEIAKSDPNFSTLVSAIVAAELDDVLSNGGPFTVFAPTNAAFAKLDPTTLNNIISNPVLLTALLQYHVVSGEVTSSDLTNGPVGTLLSGQSIDVDLSGGMVTLNGSSMVTAADIDASNGVIHVIDEVLLPADFASQTIVQIASGSDDFKILVKALLKPELSDLLAAASDPTSDLTVFAPTDEAFDATLKALGKESIDDLPIGLLKEIVTYHILGGAVMSNELTNGDVPTLLPNESVTVDITDGVKINGTKVIAEDIKAINGVVHVVESVLLPSYAATAVGTISEVILFDPNYTILVAALKTAELLETVSTTDDLTLFAPDNAAFIAAGITSLDGLDKEALTPILLYHVLGAKVLSTQLPEDGMATTLSSDQMMYLGYLNNGVVLINGLTKITGVDMEKSNGVVHTIDRTLMPPSGDVVDIAIALSDMGDDSEFTVLVSLLASDTYSDVTAALKAAENVTVFAPTDAAFGEISDLIATLTEEQIRTVLTYHAAPARVFSTDLVEGQVIGMLNGQTLKIKSIIDALIVIEDKTEDNAILNEVNIHGSNGVIHVVDKVLIPAL
ncbi:Uncaracterized surface protein containing fasciclin (FAS1) repeats [Lutibacter agarilyticus]|uniref:Uncaracterized surface protein containing fasciclin (FAS1) repeats n=1 Tax=Lutibacter agarilyticus TaxID=1109740 RepID=A0A238XYT2_9FLAO|nr:fasciclin domain-containing protein [Lutibacter agarilyticus]SNR63870.1 Uncaracterized surface protein containing fasciclin (FAS1) repeats [Lutibacter agarilyticus]